MLSTFPGVSAELKTQAFCLARSQMGYVVGDTGFSYVVGFGANWSKQVHSRDAACTLEEDAAGLCDRCALTLLPAFCLCASCVCGCGPRVTNTGGIQHDNMKGLQSGPTHLP